LQQIATNEPLPGNKLLNTSRDNQQENRGTAERGVFSASRLADIKGVEIQNSRDQRPDRDSDNSERFLIEIRQTDVVKKEFNVWAVIIKCNCNRDVQ
jgi:hypothetical protein